MNYIESMQYMNSLINTKKDTGLDNFKLLLKKLENPEKNLRFIHVTGTNGKGSVCNFINSMLIGAGYSTGMYTSPFISRFNERIKINNKEVDDILLSECITKVRNTIDSIKLNNSGFCLTYYEVITATAFLVYEKESPDFVILEVGIGGRLDCTNVITNTILSVITSIGIDHTELLGDSLDQIAYEKAGIIKDNSHVIFPEFSKNIENIIINTALSRNSKYTKVRNINLKNIVCEKNGTRFEYINIDYKIKMIGIHQATNAAIAIEVINYLYKEKYINVDHSMTKKFLEKTTVNGRMELINNNPSIYVDGAHNIQGVNSLIRSLKMMNYNKNIGVIGVLKDKNYEDMINRSLQYFDEIYFINVDNQRAKTSEELKSEFASYDNVYDENTIENTLNKILKENNTDVNVVFFGSLYMIDNVYKSVKNVI